MLYIKLERNDWGQVIDGLECRYHSWLNTYDAMDDDGNISLDWDYSEQAGPEDCDSKEEAKRVVDTYRRIIDEIEKQLLDETNILIKMGV